MTKHISTDTCTLLAKSFVTTLQQHLLIITGFFQKHGVNKPVEKNNNNAANKQKQKSNYFKTLPVQRSFHLHS